MNEKAAAEITTAEALPDGGTIRYSPVGWGDPSVEYRILTHLANADGTHTYHLERL